MLLKQLSKGMDCNVSIFENALKEPFFHCCLMHRQYNPSAIRMS